MITTLLATGLISGAGVGTEPPAPPEQPVSAGGAGRGFLRSANRDAIERTRQEMRLAPPAGQQERHGDMIAADDEEALAAIIAALVAVR